MINKAILHYIYDPLCGWCYGAAPLLKAAAGIPGLQIALHGGGLWLGERRQPMGKALRDYVRPHDERIQGLTGQPFGARYFNELLLSDGRLLDSAPPLRAILAVTALGGDGLTLLHRIQQCHYAEGRWIGALAPLAELAAEQGIDGDAFAQAYDEAKLSQHLAESQHWLHRFGGEGYPTLGLALGSEMIPLAAASFLGEPAAFAERLRSLLAR